MQVGFDAKVMKADPECLYGDSWQSKKANNIDYAKMWEKRNNLKVKKGAPPTKGAQKTK